MLSKAHRVTPSRSRKLTYLEIKRKTIRKSNKIVSSV
jgi:hypothetical protein